MNKALLVAFGVGCAAFAGALPAAEAAPVSTGVAKLDSAVPAQASTVQYRRWGGRGGGRWSGYRGGYRGWGYRGGYYRGYGYYGAGAGFLAGALVGAAVANPYYYGGPYYYGPTYYAPPPAVYRAVPSGSCWIPTDTTRGYGYYGPC
jgi:hypothetical protein